MLKSAIRSYTPEIIYDLFRRTKQERMTRQFAAYDATHNFAGKRLNMHIADPVGSAWYDHDEDNLPELEFLKRFKLAGKTIFDLGAHQCMVAMLLAELAGKAGKVVAVEANAHNQRVAERNIAMNGYRNITCLHGLVSSGKIAVSIDGGLNGRARSAGVGSAKVAVLSIDELTAVHGAPALVFLDIEGHEIEALGGATQTLSHTTSHWFIELHGDADLSTYGHKNSDIFKFFPARAFNAHILDVKSGEFLPLSTGNLPNDRCHVFFERR